MKFKSYFEKVKEFKKELDVREEFSPREKEIILESWLKNIPSQLGKKEDSNNVEITSPRLDEEKRQIQIPESFASLINKAKSTQHSDHIMLAVYYIVIQKNYESASVKDIGDEYKKAYLRPSNTNVYLANLSRRGLLMPTEKKEGKAAFIITRSGINYVEELLNRNGE